MSTSVLHALDRLQQKLLPPQALASQGSSYQEVSLTPYAPVVGATVRGLRLDQERAADPGLQAFLRDSLVRHGFLSFEPGTVSAQDFGRLVNLFGDASYTGTPFTPAAAENANLNTIDSRVKKTRMNFIWHIDQAFRPEPPRYTALFARTVPAAGGDTVFANAAAAYDLLDPLLAAYLETLSAVHDVETQGFLTLAYRDPEELARQRSRAPAIEVPLIRVHPDSGRKQVFVNELYTQRIIGLSRIASQSLLTLLFDLIKSPEVQARYRWEEGAALIWDNRTVQHRGVGDYGDGHRVLHRAVIQ